MNQPTPIERPYYEKQIEDWRTKFRERNMPEYMWSGIELYLLHGIEPGGFMSSILSNDLKASVAHADDINIGCIPDYVKFFYNTIPGGAWGSPDAFESWCAGGGMVGHFGK